MRTTLIIETLIERERTLVFDILVDLRRYSEWLPRSIVFKGTTSILRKADLRRHYLRRNQVFGEYAEERLPNCIAPDRVSYWQPMTLRPAWIGVIDVRVDDSLSEADSSTRLYTDPSSWIHGPRETLQERCGAFIQGRD